MNSSIRSGIEIGDGNAMRAPVSERSRIVHSIDTPNGIGLSPDGRTLYVAETVAARLWAFDVTAPGRVDRTRRNLFGHPGRLVVGLGGPNLFDSLAVDPAGRIVVATMPGALTVVTLSSTGRVVDLRLPSG